MLLYQPASELKSVPTAIYILCSALFHTLSTIFQTIGFYIFIWNSKSKNDKVVLTNRWIRKQIREQQNSRSKNKIKEMNVNTTKNKQQTGVRVYLKIYIP